MTRLRYTIAAALAFAFAHAASADTNVPLEGGGSSSTFALGEPAAVGTPLRRADVIAGAELAARDLDSRSGQQSEGQLAVPAQASGLRSRADVRAEGAAFSRQSPAQVFEGGESASLFEAVQSTPTRVAGQGTDQAVR
jgi:hypothetical protein